MKRSLHVLPLFIGIIAFAANASADAGKGYFFNFPGKSIPWKLMFPCPNAGKVFLYAPVAVDIVNVVCDGKPIIPELFVPSSSPWTVAGNAEGRTVVYQFTRGFFECWDNLQDKPRHVKLRSFHIPKDAKMIAVKYRIRFPDGSTSEELNVCFEESEEEVNLQAKPKHGED